MERMQVLSVDSEDGALVHSEAEVVAIIKAANALNIAFNVSSGRNEFVGTSDNGLGFGRCDARLEALRITRWQAKDKTRTWIVGARANTFGTTD